MADVIVIMGSVSDREQVQGCLDILDRLGIDFFVTVASAHRTPERVAKVIEEGEKGGARIFVCAAGMAAHLAGAVAARTLRPVIGIPITGSALAGMDALFSTVQMPAGFPVATVALDKAGAANAAWLAAEILAINDGNLAGRIAAERQKMLQKVEEAAARLENGREERMMA